MSDDDTPELNLFSRVGSLDALEEQASEARRAILGRPDDPGESRCGGQLLPPALGAAGAAVQAAA